jgi:protein-tyrosine phosphatase
LSRYGGGMSAPRESAAGTRVVDLEGCFNFRDLGGYRGVDGRLTRWRTLFRADGLYRLSPSDLERLAGFGLRTVIDLRTAAELEQRGRPEWLEPAPRFHHLPMMDVLPERSKYAEWARPDHVAEQYIDMLEGGRQTVTTALEVLCDPASYPVVAHCMAGKDRTGILCALVLGLVGVPDDVIISDYTLSADGMKRMLAWLEEAYPDQAAELSKSAAAIVAASPETMGMFLEDFRRKHGGFEEFAAGLGLPGAANDLRKVLLEP